MKGIIFREFIDFVEGSLGEDAVEDMIDLADVPSGAAYTMVGQYSWREMASLVSALSQISGHAPSALQTAFGRHLLGRLAERYPEFFETCDTTFDLLERVNSQIHVEVKKLYPDAELPTIEATPTEDGKMQVVYTSCRPFGDLCVGMIHGTSDYFGEEIELETEPHQRGLTIWVRSRGKEAA